MARRHNQVQEEVVTTEQLTETQVQEEVTTVEDTKVVEDTEATTEEVVENKESTEDVELPEKSSEEVFKYKVSILEHQFGRNVREVGMYEIFTRDNMWLFKDRNGIIISTSYEELNLAMTLFMARIYPVENRTKGSNYTWCKNI